MTTITLKTDKFRSEKPLAQMRKMFINANKKIYKKSRATLLTCCLLYTSDAADDMQCVDLGGRRIIKKIRP